MATDRQVTHYTEMARQAQMLTGAGYDDWLCAGDPAEQPQPNDDPAYDLLAEMLWETPSVLLDALNDLAYVHASVPVAALTQAGAAYDGHGKTPAELLVVMMNASSSTDMFEARTHLRWAMEEAMQARLDAEWERSNA